MIDELGSLICGIFTVRRSYSLIVNYFWACVVRFHECKTME